MNKKIVNLTPHEMTLISADGTKTVIPPSGTVARAATVSEVIGSVNGAPLVSMKHGEASGIPAPEADTLFLVSSIAAEGAKDRDDIVVATDFVRDDKGNIAGFKTFGRLA